MPFLHPCSYTLLPGMLGWQKSLLWQLWYSDGILAGAVELAISPETAFHFLLLWSLLWADDAVCLWLC